MHQARSLVSIIVFILFPTLLNNTGSQGQEKKESNGSISGQIMVKDKPAAGFELALSIFNAIPEKIIAKTVTDENGRYRFTNLSANHYWLKALAPEYITKGEYNDEGPGRKISLAQGESVNTADLNLIRGGVISGKIVDSQGKPVADEWVKLYQVNDDEIDDESFWLNNEDDNTDAQGNYRLYGIPPGRYIVAIGVDIAKINEQKRNPGDGGSLDLNMVRGNRYFEQTFYGNVIDRSKAQVIEVASEGELRGINIKTFNPGFRAYTASGRVIDESSGKPLKNCDVLIGNLKKGGYGAYIPETVTDENGHFEINGLLQGRFFVGASLKNESDLVSSRVDFEVKKNDITGLEIKVRRGLTMRGTVVIQGGNRERALEKLAQSELHVMSDVIPDLRKATINSDGTFTITGLHKGALKFSFFGGYFSIISVGHPKAHFKKHFEDDDISDFGDWLIDLDDAGLTDVHLVLNYKSGAIKGKIEIVNGRLTSQMELIASISWKTKKGGEASTTRNIDSNGVFHMDGVEPGTYTVLIYGSKGFRTDAKTVEVTTDSESAITFAIDANKVN